MQSIIEITEDGSHTLYIPELQEHYHSTHGAVQESRHVYIEAGFRHCGKPEINLLEIGFGTGLNAFLTMLEAEKSGKTVKYTSLERYPVSLSDAKKLNYSDQIAPSQIEEFMQLHTCPWGEWVGITRMKTGASQRENRDTKENCMKIQQGNALKIEGAIAGTREDHIAQKTALYLKKLQIDARNLEEFQPESPFDVVYYDAFAPEKQPDMWTEGIFNRLYALSNPGAILTTYCAKGAVRRMLQSAGYLVERLPGPPGKREILRAKK